MTGKLAWTIGLALGVLGLVLFLVGYLMRSDEALKAAAGSIPQNVPSGATIDALKSSRSKVAEDILGRRDQVIAAAGRTMNDRLDEMVTVRGRNFGTLEFPEIQARLQVRIEAITKAPTYWDNQGAVAPFPRTGSPFRFMDEKFATAEPYMRNDHMLARHAAGVAVEFIEAVEAARAEVGPEEVFDQLLFVLDGDGVRFDAVADRQVYGEADPFERRSMRAEFVASPTMAQAIIAKMRSRPMQAPLLRIVGVQQEPFGVPTGADRPLTTAEMRQLLTSFSVLPASAKLALTDMPGMSAPNAVDTWLSSAVAVAATIDDKELANFVAVPANLDRIRRIADLLPERYRTATPSKTRLTIQLLVPATDNPILGELAAARKGLPQTE